MQREEFSLRPIEESDLDTVLSWRNSDRVRAYMYTDHIITPTEHRNWFERARQSEFHPILVFEYKGAPRGLKSFSRIDRQNNHCHWGFYLGDSDIPRGCATVMGFLALEYIFEQRNFRKLYAETFAFNKSSVTYHKRLGFTQEGCFVQHVLKNGKYEDVLSFAIFREEWLALKQPLETRLFGLDGDK